ncbi:hypothetical protein L209DRAFT_271412 [Thermothelomyces heterothallicus CBS 203.75]
MFKIYLGPVCISLLFSSLVRPNIMSFLEIWAAVCDTVSGVAAIISLTPLARPSFARLRAYFRREPVPAQRQQDPEPAYINQSEGAASPDTLDDIVRRLHDLTVRGVKAQEAQVELLKELKGILGAEQ